MIPGAYVPHARLGSPQRLIVQKIPARGNTTANGEPASVAGKKPARGSAGLPDPVAFTKGVALALSATVIGLCIAIPSLVGSGYLQRKIENYAAQLDVLLERILQRSRQ